MEATASTHTNAFCVFLYKEACSCVEMCDCVCGRKTFFMIARWGTIFKGFLLFCIVILGLRTLCGWIWLVVELFIALGWAFKMCEDFSTYFFLTLLMHMVRM